MTAIHDVERVAETRSWLPAYWLCHSEGFRVDSSDGGHLGFVEEVLWSPADDDVEALVVRCCFDGPGTLTVPIDDVVDVCPEGSLIVARAAALPRRPAAAGPSTR